MGRDNIADTKGGFLKRTFLIPGKVIQWFMYMGVGSVKGYGNVRAQTRKARSPFFTWFYSIIFYLGVAFFVLVAMDEQKTVEGSGDRLASPTSSVIPTRPDTPSQSQTTLTNGTPKAKTNKSALVNTHDQPTMWRKLEEGMVKKEVIAVLGDPLRTVSNEGSETWYYNSDASAHSKVVFDKKRFRLRVASWQEPK